MLIKSPVFTQNEMIPVRHTCDGQRLSPPLAFEGVPSNARSLVLIMDDIDVPKTNRADGIWNHWLVWNIPPAVNAISEGAAPPGVQGHTTGGETEYQPPCPPEGEHRYVFRLYALDILLPADSEAMRRDELLKAADGHVVAKAELTGRYSRQRK